MCLTRSGLYLLRSESCNTIFSLLGERNKVKLAAIERSWREEQLPCWGHHDSRWFWNSIWLRLTRNRSVDERQNGTSNRKTSNMKVVEDDQIYILTKGIWISWNEHELIEDSLCQIWHLAMRNYPCMVDEKRWNWSGLKDLDEIYNFRVEPEAIWSGYGGQINELRFRWPRVSRREKGKRKP